MVITMMVVVNIWESPLIVTMMMIFEQTATVEEGGGVESRHGVGQINMGVGREKSHTIFMMEIIASLTLLPLTGNLKRHS